VKRQDVIPDSDSEVSKRETLLLEWRELLPGAPPEVRLAFVTLIQSSPRHLESYLRSKVLDTELAGLDPAHRIDRDELAARARASLRSRSSVISWPSESGKR
jgi:hypothetical protein